MADNDGFVLVKARKPKKQVTQRKINKETVHVDLCCHDHQQLSEISLPELVNDALVGTLLRRIDEARCGLIMLIRVVNTRS